jgi:hypothetical protein
MSQGASIVAVPAVEKLRARAKAVRSRALIRRYELRQLPYSRGVWYRLRRLLAGSARVLVVSPEQMEVLLGAGLAPSQVGAELSPAKAIVCVTPERARGLPFVREISPALSAELLGEMYLVLVSF